MKSMAERNRRNFYIPVAYAYALTALAAVTVGPLLFPLENDGARQTVATDFDKAKRDTTPKVITADAGILEQSQSRQKEVPAVDIILPRVEKDVSEIVKDLPKSVPLAVNPAAKTALRKAEAKIVPRRAKPATRPRASQYHGDKIHRASQSRPRRGKPLPSRRQCWFLGPLFPELARLER